MVKKDTNAREALERLFPEPFTDYQWSILSAQGYEAAVASGARSPKEVAQELKGLMQVAAAPSGDSQTHGLTGEPESLLTWEQMERLALGRILNSGEVGSSAEDRRHVGGSMRHAAASRQWRREHVLVVAVSFVTVVVVSTAAILLLFGSEWGLWGGSEDSTTTAVSDHASTSTSAIRSSTSTQPPATIPTLVPFVYVAELSGANVVPVVDTVASGTFEITLSEDRITAHYVLSVQDLSGLTLARLRVGSVGVNGEEIVTIYPGPTKKGLFSGVVSEDDFTADDFVGPLEGETMDDFIALVRAGEVYVNLGTTENRDGELRGQLGF